MSQPSERPAAAPARTGTAPVGVIHDIGYRHHAGPRLGRSAIRRALFAESLRGAYGLGRTGRAKVVPLLLLVAMCLPALIIVVIAAVIGAPELPGNYPSYVMNLQLVIALYVAGQAPASVSRDLRFRTMSLYLSRPLERIDYVVAKYAAMAAAVLVLIALPLTIMLVGALVAGLPLAEQVPDYLRAMGGAVLHALVLAGIGLVIAAMTPRRGLGVAAVITVLLVLQGIQATAQAIAFEEGRETIAGYLGLISPFTLVEGVQHQLLGAATSLPAGPPGVAGGLVFLGVSLLLVVSCFGILLLRYRRVSVS